MNILGMVIIWLTGIAITWATVWAFPGDTQAVTVEPKGATSPIVHSAQQPQHVAASDDPSLPPGGSEGEEPSNPQG